MQDKFEDRRNSDTNEKQEAQSTKVLKPQKVMSYLVETKQPFEPAEAEEFDEPREAIQI